MRTTNHTWPWERCTVIQREKISALISTFLPIEAMRRAAQKFIKLISRHEPCAWCSEKWHEIHWHWQLTAPLTYVVPTSLTICYFVLTGERHLKVHSVAVAMACCCIGRAKTEILKYQPGRVGHVGCRSRWSGWKLSVRLEPRTQFLFWYKLSFSLSSSNDIISWYGEVCSWVITMNVIIDNKTIRQQSDIEKLTYKLNECPCINENIMKLKCPV